MTDNRRAIDYSRLFEIWADFDDAKSNNKVKRLIRKNGLGTYDAMSFKGFCYGYEEAMKRLGDTIKENPS